MTCKAELRRAFPTYGAAFRYLTARGFLCVPRGWENGRWHASVEPMGGQVLVFVQLSAQ